MAQPSILWLRQDLRLADHAALTAAAAAGPVILVYVLDDETPGNWRMGAASRWWLHKSLESLGRRVPLVLRRGRADVVLSELLGQSGATSLHFTRDYAPWSAGLERRVKDACDAAGVACHRYGGYLLHEPEAIRNGLGEVYKVYTPFSKACFAAGEPRSPRPVPTFETSNHALGSDELASWDLLPRRPNWAKGFEACWEPGEEGARSRLAAFIASGLADYADARDRPDRDVTSRLSAHLHFGEISPAQCWHAVRAAQSAANGRLDRAAEKFLKEILWREFSYHLLHLRPDLPEQPFRPEFSAFPWQVNEADLVLWQQGRTGYPIVDAGMRELWSSGLDAQPRPHDRRLVPDQGSPHPLAGRRALVLGHAGRRRPRQQRCELAMGCGVRRRRRALFPRSSIPCCRARSSIPSAPMCALGAGACPASRSVRAPAVGGAYAGLAGGRG